MSRVFACIVEQHDLKLVVLAGLLCLIASVTALGLFTRARAAERGQWIWITAASIVTGGGIWSTHFVAMLAFQPDITLGYGTGFTVLSVLIAIGLTWIGFAITALRPRLALFGGGVAGLAIAIMHYVGMAALNAPWEISYDPAYVTASVAIGICLAALAFRLACTPASTRVRVLGAAALCLAICGMHFTGMAAVVFGSDSLAAVPDRVVAPEWLAFAIAVITLLIVAFGLAGTFVDQLLADRAQQEARRLRAHVAQLEATQLDLRRTAAELGAALEAAESANLAKSQFLTTMSHELRTPLNAVIGFSELITSQVYGPIGNSRYLDYAKDIQLSGTHLLDLINGILDLARLDAGQMEASLEDLDAAHAIADALGIIGAQVAKAGHAVQVEVGANAPRLRGDAKRLRQVLLNLLGNAVKFTPAPGQIRITAAPVQDRMEIRVADNGIGIAAADIPKALERFGQIDSALARRYEGSGLGLPLVKRLTELQGGSLAIDSTPGVGTTVTVALPLAQGRIAGGRGRLTSLSLDHGANAGRISASTGR